MNAVVNYVKVNVFIVSGVHGMEASYKFNSTHHLCYCLGLWKFVHLLDHVPIVCLRKPPIGVMDLGR